MRSARFGFRETAHPDPTTVAEILENCPKYRDDIEVFFNDPMTEYYVAQDCSEVITRNHAKNYKRCRAKIAAMRRVS